MKKFIVTFLVLPLLPYPLLYAQVQTNKPNDKGDYKNIQKSESSKIIWRHVIDHNYNPSKNLIWKEIDKKQQFDLIRNSNKIDENKKKLFDQIYNQQIELMLFDLGRSVPTANTLSKGDIHIRFSQVAPIKKSYYIGGTGNQNYSASINYGLTDNLMIEGFYSHSDDPLHKKIMNYDKPVSNRWISYGTSLAWRFIENNDLSVALNSSIENWNVKSGGCNLYNCKSTSNNIFTDKQEEVQNDNLIGSISLPISYKVKDKLQFNFVPRAVFLPSYQSNKFDSGKFYGTGFGIGTGIEYNLLKRIKSYGSLYFPLDSGYNSFDQNILFNKKTIYNAGLMYSLDTKIALEAGITNAFGLSPSTSTLTLPSSDELLYKTTLIYRPKNIDIPQKEIYNSKKRRLSGLSVSTAESLKQGDIYAKYYLNNYGSWSKKIEWGASNRFDFDFSISSIGQKSLFLFKPSNDKYHDLNKLFFRAGGKATFLSQKNGDFLTSAGRVSAGRLRGVGWVFVESINTYDINDQLSLNLNPKVSFGGIASPASFGTSINWRIMKDISLIPEYNFSLNESTNNYTIALKFSKLKNIDFDIFTTNSLNFIDTGQLQKSDSNSYGFSLGFIF